MDISSLTEEQQAVLQQYTSVTDQDLAAAVPLLQKCQWNVQIAVTRFFDGDAETVDPAAEAARAPAPPPPSNSGRRAETLMSSIPARSPGSRVPRRAGGGLEPAPRIVDTPEGQLARPVPFPFNVLLLPFNLTYAIFQRVLGTVGYLFPIVPRLLSRLWSGRLSQPSRDAGRRPLSPRDTAARFAREFEEEYGVAHGTLPFYEGGYANAFDAAKGELRYLLVVLLSPEHDDTAPFVRQTLLAPEVVEFVKEPGNNVLMWAGTVQDAEAYQVASALNVTRFPYACLIVHTPAVSATAMSKVATSSGPIGSEELVSKLRTAIDTHSEELERVRRQRQEQQASRSLRQEQESAYERSLAQDREKARRRREEEAAREKAEREEREREERRADEARKLAQWRQWRAQGIPPEPGAEVKDTVRVSVRLTSGERVVRRFRPDAELEELYALVECSDVMEEVAEKETEEPRGYEHRYGFRLVSPVPRQVYEIEKGGSIRDRIGRSGNLIVETIGGEEDEDEG